MIDSSWARRMALASAVMSPSRNPRPSREVDRLTFRFFSMSLCLSSSASGSAAAAQRRMSRAAPSMWVFLTSSTRRVSSSSYSFAVVSDTPRAAARMRTWSKVSSPVRALAMATSMWRAWRAVATVADAADREVWVRAAIHCDALKAPSWVQSLRPSNTPIESTIAASSTARSR